MADQTPRRKTAALAAGGVALAAVGGLVVFFLSQPPADPPPVVAAAAVTTITENTLAPATTTTAPPVTTTTAPPVTTTTAPPVTTTTAPPVTTTTAPPVTTTTAPPVTTTTAAPATTTTTTEAAPAEEPVEVALPVERPTADTVDCRGNFRRGYRVRDDCVMEAITRTLTLAWAGTREDLLAAVWYGHLLEDTLAQRMEWEQSPETQTLLEEQGFSPAVLAYTKARFNNSSHEGTTVEVHGGHWHHPDEIGVRMRVLYEGEVVMPWIGWGVYYLDGKWQMPYRAGCLLITATSNPAGAICPPDPRPDWKPEVRDGALGRMYSPVDDQENRT